MPRKTRLPPSAERVTARLTALRDGARVEIGEGKRRLIVPASVDDFAAILDKEPNATIVAGSTDVGLWVTKHMRDISPAVFIGNLDGLRTISEEKGVITIGAGVTYTEAFSTLAKRIPAMGPLFDRIGGEQVRNMGTIGGNIANGSPIGDTPPPLIALGATLTLRRGKKRRTIPLEDFFIAYGKQDRRPGEFVEAVHVPVPAKGSHFAVHKVTKRRDEDITATLGAFHLTLAKSGTVASIRIAYGGMAATPKRAKAVEAALLGKPWTEATVEAAMPAYDLDFTPLTDMRATAEYRALAAQEPAQALLRRDQRNQGAGYGHAARGGLRRTKDMALKLYYHPLASFCHKVLIALYEKDIAFEPVIVDFGNPESAAAFRKVWPMAKMPALVDEETRPDGRRDVDRAGVSGAPVSAAAGPAAGRSGRCFAGPVLGPLLRLLCRAADAEDRHRPLAARGRQRRLRRRAGETGSSGKPMA